MPEAGNSTNDQTDERPVTRLEVTIEIEPRNSREHHLHPHCGNSGNPFHRQRKGMGTPVIGHTQTSISRSGGATALARTECAVSTDANAYNRRANLVAMPLASRSP
jgi:hypothetical protein